MMILGGTISMTDDGGNSSTVDTCSDGIDNDGDGWFDYTGGNQSDDLDCDPNNPNYTGEEDGNANAYQN